MAVDNPRFSKPAAFFWLLRPNRSFMVAAITGSGAFTAGVGLMQALFLHMGLVCAWLFATRPSPKVTHILTLVFMVGTGLLIAW